MSDEQNSTQAEIQRLRADLNRAEIRDQLTDRLQKQFDGQAAASIADNLADRCEIIDGKIVDKKTGAVSAGEIISKHLEGDGAHLKPLARNQAGKFDPSRIGDPQYSAEWAAADPEGHKKALDEHVAEVFRKTQSTKI